MLIFLILEGSFFWDIVLEMSIWLDYFLVNLEIKFFWKVEIEII